MRGYKVVYFAKGLSRQSDGLVRQGYQSCVFLDINDAPIENKVAHFKTYIFFANISTFKFLSNFFFFYYWTTKGHIKTKFNKRKKLCLTSCWMIVLLIQLIWNIWVIMPFLYMFFLMYFQAQTSLVTSCSHCTWKADKLWTL